MLGIATVVGKTTSLAGRVTVAGIARVVGITLVVGIASNDTSVRSTSGRWLNIEYWCNGITLSGSHLHTHTHTCII